MLLPNKFIQAKIEDFNYSEVIKLKKKDNLTPKFVLLHNYLKFMISRQLQNNCCLYKTIVQLCKDWEQHKETSDKPEVI